MGRRARAERAASRRLFDVYRGGQTGLGKKSLTYQSAVRTLTDEEVLKIRLRIVRNDT